MNLLYIVILGFALFYALQLINRLAHLIPGDNLYTNMLLRVLPIIEMVVWLTFAFWAATIIFPDLAFRRLIFGSMAIVLVIAFGWYVLRDFLNGILLKTENTLKKGQAIKTDFISGKIIGIGHRTLRLEAENGEVVRIPFSRLGEAIISLPPQSGQSHSHSLLLPVDASKQLLVQPKDFLRELVNMPWVIAESEPGVNLIQTKEGTLLEVRFSVMKEEHALLVEKKLQEMLEKLSPKIND